MNKPKHKLVAIVFTDIAGFTELTSKNEPAALELLNTQRNILKPIVKKHNGEWLKELGDGLLLTFSTITEAVNCSIDIQKSSENIPNLKLRIGIHQGEVITSGDDVLGDDVNIASRIEPFASIGGVAVSGRVNASLERNPEFDTVFLGEPDLKGVFQSVKVYSIISHGLPKGKPLVNEEDKKDLNENIQVNKVKSKTNLFLILLLFIVFLLFYNYKKTPEISLEDNLEKIVERFDNGDNYFVFKETKKLLDIYPKNKLLKRYFEKSTYPINIKSDSLPALVLIKYGVDTLWNEIGLTPIDSIRVPWFKGKYDFQLKFKVNNRIIVATPNRSGEFNFRNIEEYPNDHAIIPETKNNMMFLPGINFGNISIETFSISKTEVSNKEFQDFVNNGGYEQKEYWDFPISVGGVKYSFEESIKRFVDKYGQYGPANWSYGQYADNTENFPVTGISWFEARAYAKYKGFKLPNIFQWLSSAGLSGFVSDLPDISRSNLKSSHLWEVSDSRGENYFGVKNIAGNVREWTTNPQGEEKNKFSILGGSYRDNSYSFNNYHGVSPFDRSIGNGFRVVKSGNSNELELLDNLVVDYIERDILSENDVSDDVFNIYKEQFSYDPYDLDPIVDSIFNYENYIAYRFQLTPAYKNNEPLHGYVIYSNKYNAKLKPIIQFPSAWAIGSNSDDWIIEFAIKNYNYLLAEGYAIICPVYYSTYNRYKILKTWWANESEDYKNTIIKIGKDYKRSIDFIESKNDFDFENLSYMGYSWGSIMSNILLAIDDRVKCAFICAGGLQVQKSKPEIDPALFTRRITIPVMHITGKNDGIFDYQNSQIPMQELLGTPLENQEMIILEGVGHIIPEDIMIENHLRWLEQYAK